MKKIVGILGYPIEHSLSPKMHNAVFEKLNMDYIYLAFEIKENYLKSAVSGIKALNIKGVNVTLPYKERIVEYVDELSKEAQVLSAINTIVNKNNKLKGYNTDVVGFCKSLQRFNIDLTNKTVLLIGAGGAAKALTYALTTYYKLKKLIIANRTYSRAEELIKKFLLIIL
jgi:shikimate dehydrogenase